MRKRLIISPEVSSKAAIPVADSSLDGHQSGIEQYTQPPPVIKYYDDPPIIYAYPKLTWSKSQIRVVHYNKLIEQTMSNDQAFSNWIRTCVMVHADNSRLETTCQVPDQFKEDVGDVITIITANAVPGRQGETHQVVEGIIHVMAHKTIEA